jgi:hypothetical protein
MFRELCDELQLLEREVLGDAMCTASETEFVRRK